MPSMSLPTCISDSVGNTSNQNLFMTCSIYMYIVQASHCNDCILGHDWTFQERH